jgi:predicted RNA-binding Zn ribbon-like protein
VPRYDVPRAADGPLRLVQLFVNTVDLERADEWLPTGDALGEWLGSHGLPVERVPTQAELGRAIALREALRELLRGNAVGGPQATAVAAVNEAALAGRVCVALDETGSPQVQARAAGVDGALGAIVAVALAAMLDGSWGRLKACRRCGWAFYDSSKNRSATWCSMQLCGNRSKTRAYRRRRTERHA